MSIKRSCGPIKVIFYFEYDNETMGEALTIGASIDGKRYKGTKYNFDRSEWATGVTEAVLALVMDIAKDD